MSNRNITTSTVIADQSRHIASIDLKLAPELVQEIEALHKAWTIPVP